ncbi:1-acyl-sn-glycerol-3-phosphate acyltransferase [bacterium]|nr:1-acyl-sn-glycerol-3-phosphate acyltransferase [bacterium]
MGSPPTTATGSVLPEYKYTTPKHNWWMMGLARLAAPLGLGLITHVDRVELGRDDREILRGLREQRVILAPNHPSFEPAVMMHLSTLLLTEFNYLVAREWFDFPLQRFICRRIGAFTVRRGMRDAASGNATVELLTSGRRWLVIFPEGENYYFNDLVLPFLPGAARFGYQAQQSLLDNGSGESVHIVPLAVRYHFRGNVDHLIRRSLSRLEDRLSLDGAGSLLERVRRLTQQVLEINERLYGLMPDEGAELDGRIARLRESVLSDIERRLAIGELDPELPLRNRLRKLFVAVSRLRSSAGSEYESQLLERRAISLKEELQRVLEFVAIQGRYLDDDPSAERCLDLLCRFEREVLGQMRFYGPRTARLGVGRPLNLRESISDWQRSGEAQVEDSTRWVENEVRSRLEQLCRDYRTEVGQ